MHLVRFDGEWRWLHILADPLPGEVGNPWKPWRGEKEICTGFVEMMRLAAIPEWTDFR